MTQEQREKTITDLLKKAEELRATKGVEYANNEDVNFNFKAIGSKLGIDPKTVLWIYATKHIQSIDSYLKTGMTLSEPIEGRIIDLINYLLILNSMTKKDDSIAINGGWFAGSK